MSPPLLDSGAPSGTLYGPSGAHSLQNPNPNGQFSASLSSRFYSVSNDQTHTMNSSNAKTGHSCLMDSNEGYPESGFNSRGLGSPKPAVGSASRLSKPRLTKMRKQAASHLPRPTPASETRTVGSDFNPHRPFSGNSATVMGTSVSGNFNFGQLNSEPFVFGTNRSNLDTDWNSGLGNSNENVGDAVLDDMRKLKIDSDKEYANTCNTLFNSNLKMSGRKSKSGINESVVSELPYGMQKLNIESSGNVEIPTNSKDVSSDPSANSKTYFCSKTVGNAANLFGRDVVSELPNELKRLNIKGTGDGIAFGRTNFDSSDGGSATTCANKMKNLNINDSASSCVGEKEVNVTTIGGDNKKDKFSFPGKWENIGTHVEFKTPDMRAKLHSHSNQNLEHSAKRELFRDNRSKKKKGKSKKSTLVQGWLGQDFMSRESGLQENPETSEPYSPMDISPYQETLAEGRCSRETSVTSNESFHLDSYRASGDTHLKASNITTNEDLVNATQHLDISEVDAGHTETKEEGTEYFFDKGVGAERLPEESISGTETESFITANEHFETISESSVTSAENEVSSSSNIERQDSDGGMQFCFASGSENTGQHNFTFSASSSAQNQSAVAARHLKKKNRMKVGHDSYISTPNAKLPYASSSVQFSPLSGTSLHLPAGQGKGGDASTMQPKFEAVKGLETKQETVSIPAASVAAQEACEKWRLRGNQAYANGELSKAEEYYTRGLSCVSQNETSRSCLRALMLCYSNRAATQMSLGRMRKALRDCEMAAKIDPNFLRVQVRAANCYLALGEIEDAVLHFKKCLQSGSDVCVDRKLLVEASEGLQKAQKLSDFISHSADLLQRRSSSDTQNALEVIAEALTISSYSEKLHHMKADGLFMLRKYEEVIQLCESTLHSAEMNSPESVLDGAPEHLDDSDLQQNASFRLWRCQLIVKSYFYLGRLEEALDFLKKQEESGSILEKNGSKSLEKIIPLAGTVRELLRLKTAGNEAFQSGRHAEAVDHYTAALSCNVESRPFVAVCFCNRAAAYRALGQITEAIADCSLAIALDGNYLKAISRRAALYENIRDYGQAAIDLERLVSLLTRQVEENATNYGGSDRNNCVNELRQAQLRLSIVEEEARKEIPLNMYLILGVEPSVAASEIKKAYRKAALRHHPDKAGQSLARSENGDDGVWKEVAEEVHKDADRLFKMIGEAYAVLSDPTKRSRYDLEEEVRNSQKRGGGISISRTHSDVQNYPFERGSSRRQWHEVWRSHGNSQTRGSETTRSYRYS